MHKKNKIFVLFLFLFVIISSFSYSDIPKIISYSGRLLDSSGSPVTTAKTLKFKIYDAQTGGNLLWTSSDYSVTADSSGVFSILLGSQNDELGSDVFEGIVRYLEILVAGESLSPRLRFASGPYSFKALLADNVPDESITSSKLALLAVAKDNIANRTITYDKIALGTITSGEVASSNFVKKIVAGNNVTISADEGTGSGIVTINSSGGSGGSGTITTIESGAGLTGGPITTTGTLSVKYDNSTIGLNTSSGSLEIKDSSITMAKLASNIGINTTGTITAGAFSGGTFTGTFTGEGSGITGITATIGDGSITSAKLANNAVTSSKIADNSVTAGKMATDINLTTSGTITATSFVGDGSGITGISATTNATTLNSQEGSYYLNRINHTGTQDWNTISTTTNKVNLASQVTGSLPDTNLATITTAGKVSGNTITTGTITGDANINTTGVITAAAFDGDGSLLDNISATIADGAITTAKIANDAITSTKIAGNAVTTSAITDANVTSDKVNFNYAGSSSKGGSATSVATGAIDTGALAANAVTSAKIADGSITTEKITNEVSISTSGTITAGAFVGNGAGLTSVPVTIADGSITSAKIADETIVDGDISNSATIAWSKISKSGAVAGDIGAMSPSLANGKIFVGDGSGNAAAVTMGGDATLANNGTLTIASGAITTDKIGVGAVIAGAIGTGAVGTSKIADSSIMAAHMSLNSVTRDAIVSGAINGSKLQSGINISTTGTITAAAFSVGSGTFTGDGSGLINVSATVADGSITSAKIATWAVTTEKIGIAAVGGVQIANGSIGTSHIVTGAVTGTQIATGAIIASHISDGNVGSTQIATGAITDTKIADGNVTSAKITDGTIVDGDINNDAAIAWSKISKSGAAAGDIGAMSPSLANGKIFVGDGSGNAAAVFMGGDAALANNGVLTIIPGAITEGKIGTGAVTADAIAFTSVDTPHLAANAVTSFKLADGAVTTAKIVAGAVGTAQITNEVSINTTGTIEAKRLQINNGALLSFGSTDDIAEETLSAPSNLANIFAYVPSKAALVVGSSTGDEWLLSGIGTNSFAFGSSVASYGSHAFGFGGSVIAGGAYSIAMGNTAQATGSSAVALGDTIFASGNYSIALGSSSVAGNNNSTVIGTYLSTGAIKTMVLGYGVDADHLLTNSKANSMMVGFGGTLPILYVSGESVNGVVGIGTTEPTVRLDVNGNGRFRAVGSGTYGSDLNIMADGTLTTATSDLRKKTNLKPLENSLDKVLKLQGYSFNWKESPNDPKDIGLIAQDVEKIIPEVVFTNRTDGYMGINYSKLPAVLIEAIKEQQNKIENQNKEIETLKNELLKLKEDISAIKKP